MVSIKNPANWKSNLLQSAIMTGDLAPARLLVELGADVNARGDGLCPIFAALDADDPQFLELLITNGADASFIHEGDNMVTKVVRSKSEAKLSLLSMVLKHGADPNWSKEDCTPLMCAALRGFKQAAEMCQILILHGALVNARNSEDKTALHFSVKENNVNPLKVLLSHGADVNARDQNGESALHTAAGYFSRGKFDHYFDTQELLLQSGADQTIKNLAGKLPFQEFLIRLCDMWHPEVGILQNHIQLFARFSPSPSDLVATACADGEAIKRAAELEDSAILKVLLSHGVPSSGDILRECIYSSIYHTRPQSLRVLMKHANLFRVANSKHLSFLFLIKISRDIHRCCHSNPDVNISMEARVRTAKSLPLQHPRLFISTDKHCEILKDIWNAGFDTNTILDERFVSLVSTYDDEFSSLVRDAEQFGNPISSPGRETISAVVYAAQHIPSAMVVLALLKVNSHRDNLTDEGILEAFIRSAIYDNLEVYDACRNGFLGRIDGGGSEDCQSRETSGGTFKRHISQELRRIAEGFPFSGGRGGPDFYIALCQAMRAEGFEKKTFSCGRTLFELAERAENWRLLNLLRDGIPL
ncbi:ankyrin repeat-containing domain protein [Nemania diffusa]|nr:ankyrin repeat-containing domain protein [Nemania diffusa]